MSYVNTSDNAVNKNMIIPEVYAAIVNEKIAGKVVVSQACEHYGDLMGKPGETLTFPKTEYIGDAQEIVVGEPIPVSKLSQTTTQATITEIAPDGIKIFDYDNKTELGNTIDKGAEQQAIAIARKQDSMAIACAYATPLQKELAKDGEVTFFEMNAILGMYGDDANASDFWGIVVHSAYIPSLLTMDGFVSAELTHTADGNGIQENNLIGYFRGIKVFVSDRLYDTTTSEYFILAIKKGALGIIPKESVFVETARDASIRATTVFTSQFLAMALVDDTGVVLAKKTLPSFSV